MGKHRVKSRERDRRVAEKKGGVECEIHTGWASLELHYRRADLGPHGAVDGPVLVSTDGLHVEDGEVPRLLDCNALLDRLGLADAEAAVAVARDGEDGGALDLSETGLVGDETGDQRLGPGVKFLDVLDVEARLPLHLLVLAGRVQGAVLRVRGRLEQTLDAAEVLAEARGDGAVRRLVEAHERRVLLEVLGLQDVEVHLLG